MPNFRYTLRLSLVLFLTAASQPYIVVDAQAQARAMREGSGGGGGGGGRDTSQPSTCDRQAAQRCQSATNRKKFDCSLPGQLTDCWAHALDAYSECKSDAGCR